MKKQKLLSLAVGSAFAAVALAPVAHAADNPFAASELKSGYLLAEAGKGAEAKCGGEKKVEYKCGGDKKAEHKCGGDKKGEHKCGGAKTEATSGTKADKKVEGKCGEAKCGAKKAKKAETTSGTKPAEKAAEPAKK
ncbi:MAG: hypothetical protein RIR70_1590 [Pseudomonadota bacterium]|jgi:uncharacterized low-complexity protein